jgi:hypothetical protein
MGVGHGSAAAGVDRRQLMVSGGLIAAAAATPFWIWRQFRSGPVGEASERELAILQRVCEVVIPSTDTESAADVGTPDFIVLALNHGLDGTGAAVGSSNQALPPAKRQPPPEGLFVLDMFMDDLRAVSRGNFLRLEPAEQVAALTRLDQAAFAPGGEDAAWHKIKDLVLTGYYTSQPGATKELQYELVPGRWDGDLPLPPDPRSFSSDWTAVTFG